MNPHIELTDDLLRDALRVERPATEPFDLMPAIAVRLTTSRQRSRRTWPWESSAVAPPTTPARLAWTGAVLLLILAALIGAALLIGSLTRPAFPLAGKVVVSFGEQLVFVDPATGQASAEFSGGLQPAYSPDGRHIAYIVPGVRGLQIAIAGTDRAIERTITLGPPVAPGGWLSWSGDGSELAFDADIGGSGHVFVVERRGGTPRDLTPNNAQYSMPALSPDGRTLAVRALDAHGASLSPPQWDLWLVDLESGSVAHRIGPLADGYAALSGYWQAQWAPDSSRIVFDAGGLGAFRMFIVNADGTDLRRLAADLNPWSPLWSPDGRTILFESFDTGPSHHGDAWVIDPGTLAEREIFPDADVWAWSADPPGILYASPSCASESSPPAACRPDLYIDELDGRGPHLLVTSDQIMVAAGDQSRTTGPTSQGFLSAAWGRAP